jgi:lipoprotein NlpD
MRHESAASLLCAALASILLASCSSEPYRPAAGRGYAAPGSYVVRSGDTVSKIAARFRVDYRELARLNNIGSDYLIYPGQVLRIPGPNSTRSLPPPVVAKSTPPGAPPVAPPIASPITPPLAIAPAPNAFPPSLPTQWTAPAALERATLVTRPNGSVGLSFAGNEDQEIVAAADGKVIYTGVGALGYGLLVIIKHTETCLSAYGYTRLLKVREGDDVTAGQPIATMGYEPQGNVALYFEIRLNGRTTDPRPLLAAGTNSVAVTTTPLTE